MQRIYKIGLLSLLGTLSFACGGASINETRMTYAPPREEACALEFVEADISSVSFLQTWDVLGYVSVGRQGTQDPLSPANRNIVRPRACAMGGTTVAIAIEGTNTNMYGSRASNIAYMILRPKSNEPARPTAF